MCEEERRQAANNVSLGCQSYEIVNEGLETSPRVAVFMTKQLIYIYIYIYIIRTDTTLYFIRLY